MKFYILEGDDPLEHSSSISSTMKDFGHIEVYGPAYADLIIIPASIQAKIAIIRNEPPKSPTINRYSSVENFIGLMFPIDSNE